MEFMIPSVGLAPASPPGTGNMLRPPRGIARPPTPAAGVIAKKQTNQLRDGVRTAIHEGFMTSSGMPRDPSCPPGASGCYTRR